ncbi:uncharacterized protein LOC113385118 isoform X2 [Ctenocephalides felis]|uniref:uncharacterized protein LOC113375500 isoform X2 n=1 Tax=Ctenocephalides felis TaxID=7515 RepID=UPI000E6E5248|nr:uncharacterized protein LOC113375500 isoform X2 [Ctenocephalides felis]XP_026480351.1 uncharacterized protein LOC113385118 isoform X2 [Ctenocephalides felis]
MYKTNQMMKAAASAAAKVDSLLMAKGKLRMDNPKLGLLPTPGKPNDLFTTEVEINDTPLSARNLLTKGQTQEEISQYSGAAISTRGRYMTQNEGLQNPNDRALYLFIQGPTKQSLDLAIQRIHEIIRSEQNQTNQRYLSRNKPQLPPLMSIQTNVTSIDKVMVGLDHAPPAFDLRGRIIGQGGTNLEYIRTETGAVVTLRGRGSLFTESASGTESPEPLHFFIEHPRYDGVVAARQLALNLIETLQQELAQFLQTNPPSMVNIQAIPQNTMQQNIVQHSPQVFPSVHQPIAIPPPILSGPPPVQHPQVQQNILNQHNLINQSALQVQPSLNIIQPNIQPNVINAQGIIQQQQIQQPLLVQQSQSGMVLNNVSQNIQLPQVNLPPPGVHIPQQQGPLVSSNIQSSQQQQILLSHPPPTMNIPPPNMPPPNQGLIIVSSAPSQYSQQPQMFVSQATQINPVQSLNQQMNTPYQYHIIQGSNPIYATAQQLGNSAGGVVTGQINELKPNAGQQFQTMTVQQVYQQPIITGQEQIVTQTLPPGQQYIVAPNSGPIYIVPPPSQTVQTQPNQTIETISVQSHHHIIPNSIHNQHDPQSIINQTVTIDNSANMNQLQNIQTEPIENRDKDTEEVKNPLTENTASRNENDAKEDSSNDSSNPQEKSVAVECLSQLQPNQVASQSDSANNIDTHQIQNQDNLHQGSANNEVFLNQAPPPTQIIQHQMNPPPILQMPPQIVPPPNHASPQMPMFSVANQQIIAKPQFQINSQPQNWVQTHQQNWIPNTSQILTHTTNLTGTPYQTLPNQFVQNQGPNSTLLTSQISNQELDEENRQLNQQNLMVSVNSSTCSIQNNLDVTTMQAPSQNMVSRPRIGQKRKIYDENWRFKQGIGFII